MYSHPFYGILCQRLNQWNTARKNFFKKLKANKKKKKRRDMFLFVDNIIIYIGNTKKLVTRITESSNLQDIKPINKNQLHKQSLRISTT